MHSKKQMTQCTARRAVPGVCGFVSVLVCVSEHVSVCVMHSKKQMTQCTARRAVPGVCGFVSV